MILLGHLVGVPKWTFGYDGAMQLVEAVAADGSEDVIEHERYGYDKAGNRIQVVTGTTSSPAVRNYKVNNLNQLVSERGFGRTLFSGEVDEPATVTVNGQPAKVMSTGGSAPFRFEAWVQLPAGTSEVVIEAKDGNDNTTTETYEVTTTGTTALFTYVSVRAQLGGFDLGRLAHGARVSGYPAGSASLIQFWGKSSWMRLAGWVRVRTTTSAR